MVDAHRPRVEVEPVEPCLGAGQHRALLGRPAQRHGAEPTTRRPARCGRTAATRSAVALRRVALADVPLVVPVLGSAAPLGVAAASLGVAAASLGVAAASLGVAAAAGADAGAPFGSAGVVVFAAAAFAVGFGFAFALGVAAAVGLALAVADPLGAAEGRAVGFAAAGLVAFAVAGFAGVVAFAVAGFARPGAVAFAGAGVVAFAVAAFGAAFVLRVALEVAERGALRSPAFGAPTERGDAEAPRRVPAVAPAGVAAVPRVRDAAARLALVEVPGVFGAAATGSSSDRSRPTRSVPVATALRPTPTTESMMSLGLIAIPGRLPGRRATHTGSTYGGQSIHGSPQPSAQPPRQPETRSITVPSPRRSAPHARASRGLGLEMEDEVVGRSASLSPLPRLTDLLEDLRRWSGDEVGKPVRESGASGPVLQEARCIPNDRPDGARGRWGGHPNAARNRSQTRGVANDEARRRAAVVLPARPGDALPAGVEADARDLRNTWPLFA